MMKDSVGRLMGRREVLEGTAEVCPRGPGRPDLGALCPAPSVDFRTTAPIMDPVSERPRVAAVGSRGTIV